MWEVATQPYAGAHFATFPLALVEPCIKAGSSEKGVCPECGKPWGRVVEKGRDIPQSWAPGTRTAHRLGKGRHGATSVFETDTIKERKTTGWQPSCDHGLEPVPAVVFDPFVGSGTVALAARMLGRNAIGTDLSFAYLHDQARQRMELDQPAMWEGARQEETNLDGLPLFQKGENS